MPELLVLARTMRLYTMEAWVSDPEVLTDESRLRDALRAGARAGGATVLDETFCVFSNGAVTGVLVLAHPAREHDRLRVDLVEPELAEFRLRPGDRASVRFRSVS